MAEFPPWVESQEKMPPSREPVLAYWDGVHVILTFVPDAAGAWVNDSTWVLCSELGDFRWMFLPPEPELEVGGDS